jgi:hypothetical protein
LFLEALLTLPSLFIENVSKTYFDPSSTKRRFALTTRSTHKLEPDARYQEHRRLEALLSVPSPPALAPLTYYAQSQWAQDLVFGAHTGEPLDHVAYAAILEQIFGELSCVNSFLIENYY